MAKVLQMTTDTGALKAIVVDSITGVTLDGNTITIHQGDYWSEFTSETPVAKFDTIINQIKYPDGR